MPATTTKQTSRTVDAKAFIAAARFLGSYPAILTHVMRRDAVVETARQNGQAPSTEELQAETDAFRRALGLHSAKETTAWLGAVGYSLDDLEKEMEYRLLRRKRKDALTKQEVETWFNDHRSELDRARVSQITVKSEGVAKELAAQVKNEGKEFRALAQKHATDERGRESGGYLGWVRRGDLGAQAAKVFAAGANECLPPQKNADGTAQVVCVHEVKKAALDKETEALVREALLEKHLEGLVAGVQVEVK